MDEHPQTAYETPKGTIICRDPQIQFDDKQWLSDNFRKNSGSLRTILGHIKYQAAQQNAKALEY